MLDRKPQNIGERIRMMREALGLTQEEFGDRLHVTRSVISRWEKNDREVKSDDVVALADFCEVPCDFILRGIDSKQADIHRTTGLDHKAISILEMLQKEKPKAIEIVNYLLSHDSMVEALAKIDAMQATLFMLSRTKSVSAFAESSTKDKTAEEFYSILLLRMLPEAPTLFKQEATQLFQSILDDYAKMKGEQFHAAQSNS